LFNQDREDDDKVISYIFLEKIVFLFNFLIIKAFVASCMM